MKRSRSVTLAAAAAFVLAACSEAPTGSPPIEEVTMELGARGGNGGGGGGGGATDPTATFILPTTGAGLLSDGNGDYVNGSCGVEGKIFATEAASNSGDATLNLLNSKKGKCSRTVKIVYDDGTEELVRVFINVKNIHNTETVLSLDEVVTRGMNVNPWSGSRCEVLHFREVLQDGETQVPGNSVKVQRTAADTWHVYNEVGANSAACRLSDGTYDSVTLPLDFEIVSSVALAWPQ